eukprot:COSAG01_NODE_591_length_15119_cov_19.340879_13_plen_65_part_00
MIGLSFCQFYLRGAKPPAIHWRNDLHQMRMVAVAHHAACLESLSLEILWPPIAFVVFGIGVAHQ